MESETNKLIDNTIDEDLIIVKSVVDFHITYFELNYTLELRNQTILDIFDMVRKKYIATNNSKYYSDKRTTINLLVKSFILKKF
jgi:hypothetical protein